MNQLIKTIHDAVVESGEFRARLEGESWYAWMRAYLWDVFDERAEEMWVRP